MSTKTHWSGVLTSYFEHPENHQEDILYQDKDVTVLYDKFPKAQVHLLAIPSFVLSGFSSLNETHLPLLHKMRECGLAMAQKITPEKAMKFKTGFHAVPSLKQLHLHVISTDLDSPKMKHNKHWNSFTTEFFVDFQDFVGQVQRDNRVQFDEAYYEGLLRQKPRCHKCSTEFATFPNLKSHLPSCPDPK
eukprot:TRINITY_DN5485_c0_g1_i2.p1 TRINITY_DN5485_c0_g1~~TRINITY_DN5485_c0_g1_i2.p1  ORF type:complete len:189 (-),score=29.76 TRINITY_DN5485_c0_g1_i2:14-580(-)